MHIAKIILLILYAVALGVALAKHGEPKTGLFSFWSSLIGTVIELGLLWWGGFFD